MLVSSQSQPTRLASVCGSSKVDKSKRLAGLVEVEVEAEGEAEVDTETETEEGAQPLDWLDLIKFSSTFHYGAKISQVKVFCTKHRAMICESFLGIVI